jgi:hypothetical protein
MKKYCVVILIIPLFILSCKSGPQNGAELALADVSSGSRFEASPAPVMDKMASQPAPEAANYDPLIASRKIIRDGNMEIRVNNVDHGKATVDTLLKKYKAYYSNESRNNTDYAKGYSLTIRVPADNFDALIEAIEKGGGEVVYKNITSRDVTEEFIDLETRLSNKMAYLERYGQLLKQAKSVKDILEIEEKTRVIEEEIESTQGRLKYLNSQVDYSTLILQISKKNDYNVYSHNNQGSFFDRLWMSLVKGWFGLVSFVFFVIRIWPFWLIAGTLYYFIRKFWKRKKRN